MNLTFLKVGDVPPALRDHFDPYARMFARMFEATGQSFALDVVRVNEGETLPDPARLEGIIVPGSSAGVYDDLPWIRPLRDFVRGAYAANIPMVGVCFGHQIIADALGGDVRKSERGWGLGRHVYDVRSRPLALATAPPSLAVACSHQDQVITPPADATVVLSSEFTPNAGLVYANGKVVTVQPHPEFDDDYASALIDLRQGIAADDVVEAARGSMATPSQSRDLAGYLAAFLKS